MIHFGFLSGGASSGPVSVAFSPDGGTYNTTHGVLVNITVTGASKLRWRKAGGAWTTVNAATTTINVKPTVGGTDADADALDTSNTVLASHSATFQYDSGR